MEASACHLSQSSVGLPLHSIAVSLAFVVGGFSLPLNTPSRLLFPRSAGAAYLVF